MQRLEKWSKLNVCTIRTVTQPETGLCVKHELTTYCIFPPCCIMEWDVEMALNRKVLYVVWLNRGMGLCSACLAVQRVLLSFVTNTPNSSSVQFIPLNQPSPVLFWDISLVKWIHNSFSSLGCALGHCLQILHGVLGLSNSEKDWHHFAVLCHKDLCIKVNKIDCLLYEGSVAIRKEKPFVALVVMLTSFLAIDTAIYAKLCHQQCRMLPLWTNDYFMLLFTDRLS